LFLTDDDVQSKLIKIRKESMKAMLA